MRVYLLVVAGYKQVLCYAVIVPRLPYGAY
jgi:hypothetical protein